MKLEDFGYDPKTKIHNSTLTAAESRFLGILWLDHVGEENAICANDLAITYANALDGREIDRKELMRLKVLMNSTDGHRRQLDRWKRNVRHMQSHLQMTHENLPILSRSGHKGGYWIAENDAEIDQYFGSFRKRGMHGIVKASRASKTRFANIMQQLTFEFEDLVDKAGDVPAVIDSRSPAPYVVVDALLEKMMKNPEQFSEELRKLGAKFGSVLLPKAQYAQIKSHTQRLQELIAGMEV